MHQSYIRWIDPLRSSGQLNNCQPMCNTFFPLFYHLIFGAMLHEIHSKDILSELYFIMHLPSQLKRTPKNLDFKNERFKNPP